MGSGQGKTTDVHSPSIFSVSSCSGQMGIPGLLPTSKGPSSLCLLPLSLKTSPSPRGRGPHTSSQLLEAQISHSVGPFRGISETSCATTCHLLVSESFLSKELSSALLSQVAGCHLKRQLKSLTMAGLESALTGLVSESLAPQQNLSLIMFRYVRGGIRLEERMLELGV